MSSTIRKALQTERREKYLQNLVNEAITQILTEQAAPVASPELPDAPPAPPAPPAPATPEPLPVTTAEEFTVDDMIERLNVIRGGRSFTDPEVYGQLVSFFKTLTEEQKKNSKDFLVSLGKIVINVNEQTETAEEVSAAPPATPPAPPAPPVAPPPAVPVAPTA
jgi:hypothetical protein